MRILKDHNMCPNSSGNLYGSEVDRLGRVDLFDLIPDLLIKWTGSFGRLWSSLNTKYPKEERKQPIHSLIINEVWLG